MINANELRIGNKLWKDGIIVIIDALSIYDIWKQSDRYSPILLTTQLLLNFGFIKWKELHFQQWGYVNRNVIIEVNEDGNILYINEPNIYWPIKTVHQLRNLFYALTGKELEI